MPPVSTSKQTGTVLVVDGVNSARERLCAIFEKAGYRALVAQDVASTLRTVQTETCDLLVINLDNIEDGLAVCRLIRARPSTSRIPIIAVSNSSDDTEKNKSFGAGVDDYISRPSSPAEIVSRAGAHLRAAEREWELIGSNRELRFLADLGRGLLRTVEPEQLVRRVAGATYEGTGAALCAAIVTNEPGEAACVFDREGSAEDASLLNLERLRNWLDSSALLPVLNSDNDTFFLRDESRAIEYAAPLRFGGKAKGALVVAFDKREECDDTVCRLVDAAAQQAALAAHISALYQAARDASANLAVEVELRTAEVEAQRRFIEAIIDSLPLSLYAIDRDYKVVAWNRNRELGELGIPRGSVLGKNIFNVLTRQRRDLLEAEFERVFTTGEIERIEHETATKDGAIKHWLISKIPMWIDRHGQVSHVITVGEDITDRVEANRAVAGAEKLAAVGRLAAGVVHEINNPLATISACAEALESRVNEGAFAGSEALDDLREYLGLIRSEAFRCKNITMGLLDFSRSRASGRTPVNVGEVVDSAARLLAHQQRGSAVTFDIQKDSSAPSVSGDPGQLQQVIIALATNAVDAMPNGGQLTITTKRNGRSVVIEVIDTGSGIPAENVPKIFEPFFTTKEVGKGTGLGLAVCYGILTEHGGSLDVQSTLGVGTTFTISLPAISDDGDE
ncbi:MAG TPA: ATP-binding protein [Pyrinomonadaceae bacterium]|nr:ATP-binding protein [Pyrinomonadaceae bacterium]